MIPRRNIVLILLAVTLLCTSSISAVNAAGYVIGSPTRPLSVSNTNPMTVTAASSGIAHAVGGTSPVALLQRASKANKLNIVWDDTVPVAPWASVYPIQMKGMSTADIIPGTFGLFIASQDQYDAPTKSFNWNGPAGSWAVFIAPIADNDLLPCGVISPLQPGSIVGNVYDKGTWLILGHWASGAPPLTPPGFTPDTYVAIFVATGNANIRVETTYPTAWFTAVPPLYPFYSLNWQYTGAPPLYMTNHIGGYAAYVAPPADPILYMDTSKVKHRHTINAVGQGTNYIYVAPDDGTGAPFLPKMKSVRVMVKRGVTATAKVSLK